MYLMFQDDNNWSVATAVGNAKEQIVDDIIRFWSAYLTDVRLSEGGDKLSGSTRLVRCEIRTIAKIESSVLRNVLATPTVVDVVISGQNVDVMIARLSTVVDTLAHIGSTLGFHPVRRVTRRKQHGGATMRHTRRRQWGITFGTRIFR